MVNMALQMGHAAFSTPSPHPASPPSVNFRCTAAERLPCAESSKTSDPAALQHPKTPGGCDRGAIAEKVSSFSIALACCDCPWGSCSAVPSVAPESSEESSMSNDGIMILLVVLAPSGAGALAAGAGAPASAIVGGLPTRLSTPSLEGACCGPAASSSSSDSSESVRSNEGIATRRRCGSGAAISTAAAAQGGILFATPLNPLRWPQPLGGAAPRFFKKRQIVEERSSTFCAGFGVCCNYLSALSWTR